MKSKLRKVARLFLKGSAILTGWLILMAAYFPIYQAFENLAVPVSVNPLKDFEDAKWER